MKKNITYICAIVLATGLFACDDNEIMPEYKKVGTATSTVATVTPSNDKPLPAENLTLTVSYVSPSEDPLKEVVLKVKVSAGEFIELETFNAESEAKDEEITHTVNYTITAPSKTSVTFDLVLSSQKPYPMVRRTTVAVQ